jgi:hypothetical protein
MDVHVCPMNDNEGKNIPESLEIPESLRNSVKSVYFRECLLEYKKGVSLAEKILDSFSKANNIGMALQYCMKPEDINPDFFGLFQLAWKIKD